MHFWQVQTVGTSPEFWSAMPSSPTAYTVTVGTALIFRFSTYHNLYLMEDVNAYDSCDLSHSVKLAETNHGGRETDQPAMPANKYEVVITAAGTYYFACHVPGHCASGQKIAVTVVDAPSSPPPPAPPTQPTPPSSCGGGCIGGIVGGSFVPMLMLLLWLGGAFGGRCPSPLRRPPPATPKGAQDAVTSASVA